MRVLTSINRYPRDVGPIIPSILVLDADANRRSKTNRTEFYVEELRGGNRFFDALTRSLGHTNPIVRATALQEICIRCESGEFQTNLLTGALGSKDDYLRTNALETLKRVQMAATEQARKELEN